MVTLSFKKDLKLQNILFDEFITEFNHISIISFNYDSEGTALCRCDGQLKQIPTSIINKIIFGVSKQDIVNFLQGIFDPHVHTDELKRQSGEISFRLPELQKIKKYDVDNLAKKTLKGIQDLEIDSFVYFLETDEQSLAEEPKASPKLYGNTTSKIFHKSDCKSFNSISCTSMFTSSSEALSAGFKACGLCKP